MYSLQEYIDVDSTGLIAIALDVGASVQWFKLYPDWCYGIVAFPQPICVCAIVSAFIVIPPLPTLARNIS